MRYGAQPNPSCLSAPLCSDQQHYPLSMSSVKTLPNSHCYSFSNGRSHPAVAARDQIDVTNADISQFESTSLFPSAASSLLPGYSTFTTPTGSAVSTQGCLWPGRGLAPPSFGDHTESYAGWDLNSGNIFISADSQKDAHELDELGNFIDKDILLANEDLGEEALGDYCDVIAGFGVDGHHMARAVCKCLTALLFSQGKYHFIDVVAIFMNIIIYDGATFISQESA
ncbi:unnamed protein product [Protopolystoma xenopodis]|uniref:Uncharacterized protein n=1 Tax=Protopolystoma xenopodis TaxID=117903 RepID=A0A3S5B2U5_9PLAT|nr:unnamed protein product [Protopolystoma xenopodis]